MFSSPGPWTLTGFNRRLQGVCFVAVNQLSKIFPPTVPLGAPVNLRAWNASAEVENWAPRVRRPEVWFPSCFTDQGPPVMTDFQIKVSIQHTVLKFYRCLEGETETAKKNAWKHCKSRKFPKEKKNVSKKYEKTIVVGISQIRGVCCQHPRTPPCQPARHPARPPPMQHLGGEVSGLQGWRKGMALHLQITHLERKMIFHTSMIMFQPFIFWGVKFGECMSRTCFLEVAKS